MLSYLRSLILIGAVCTLASCLIPGRDARTAHLIEYALGLWLLLALCQPLTQLGTWAPSLALPDISDSVAGERDPDTWDALCAGVAQGIRQDLCRAYSLPEDSLAVHVTLLLEGDALTPCDLTVTVRGVASAADLLGMQQYIEQTYQAVGEVKIDVQ